MEELSPDSKYIDNQPFVPLEQNSQALFSSEENAIASQSNGRTHVEQGIAGEEYMLTFSETGSEPNVFQLTNSQSGLMSATSSSFVLEDYIACISGNSLNHEGNSSETTQGLSQETGQHSVQQQPKCPDDILQSVQAHKCTSQSVTQSATQGSVGDPLEQLLYTSTLWGYHIPDDSQGNCIHYDASLPCSHACQLSCSETDGWIPPCSCCLEVAQTSKSDE